MLRRASAALLLILTTSPFTAPFATCDVMTLLGHEASTAPQHAAVTAAVEDGSHGIPLCAASNGLRTRLKLMSRNSAGAGVLPAAVVAWTAPAGAQAPRPHRRASVLVSLRI